MSFKIRRLRSFIWLNWKLSKGQLGDRVLGVTVEPAKPTGQVRNDLCKPVVYQSSRPEGPIYRDESAFQEESSLTRTEGKTRYTKGSGSRFCTSVRVSTVCSWQVCTRVCGFAHLKTQDVLLGQSLVPLGCRNVMYFKAYKSCREVQSHTSFEVRTLMSEISTL